MTEQTKLEPCPFCQRCRIQIEWEDATANDKEMFSVVCFCGGRAGWHDKREWAIAAWNRRTPPDASKEK